MAKHKVFFGQLSQDIVEYVVKEGTTVGQFCEEHDLSLDSSLRVNAKEIKNAQQVLRPNDIITAIDNIDGGF